MKDGRSRGIEYLRISVTDRCNFRCTYCMPEEGIESIVHDEVLRFEEILKICGAMAKLGVKKIKLTGGEPLVRKGFTSLVRDINQIEGIEEITLTTNGFLLSENLEELIKAGISSINISLDTLDAKRFKEITRVDGLQRVLDAIHKAAQSSLKSVKVNALVAKHLNEQDIIGLVKLAQNERIHVRFIELMPIGLGKSLEPMKKSEIMERIEAVYGKLTPYNEKLGNGPSKYYALEGFKGKIGFISAVSECFCEGCNRIRLTADGFLKLCLHSSKGLDLKTPIREGVQEEELIKIISQAIMSKPERHHFGEENKGQFESKIMAQIGG